MTQRSNPDTRLLPFYAHLCPSCHNLDWAKNTWINEGSCYICRSGIAAVAKYQICAFRTCRRHWGEAKKLMALAHAVVMLDGFTGA